jgi:hypothetical protein
MGWGYFSADRGCGSFLTFPVDATEKMSNNKVYQAKPAEPPTMTDLYKNKVFARATVQAWILSEAQKREVHDLELVVKFSRVFQASLDEFVTELQDSGLITARNIQSIEDG